MPKSAPDILVIGGGVIGLVGAFTLQRAGLNVGLVEARRIGAGASGWAGGIVRRLHDDCTDVDRAAAGLRILRDLRRAIGVDVPFHETGYVRFPEGATAGSQTAIAGRSGLNGHRRLSPGIARLMAEGAVIWQDHAALERLYPGFAAQGPGAWLEPAAGWADPRLVCLAYGQAFVRLGGALLEGIRVDGIRPVAGGITLSTTLGEMCARHVVLALGDGLPGFLDLHGIDHAFYVKPIEVALFAPPGPCHAPCFTDDAYDVYGKPDADGAAFISVTPGAGMAAPYRDPRRSMPRICAPPAALPRRVFPGSGKPRFTAACAMVSAFTNRESPWSTRSMPVPAPMRIWPASSLPAASAARASRWPPGLPDAFWN